VQARTRRIAVIAAVVLGVAFLWKFTPTGDVVLGFVAGMENAGPAGWAAFTAMYVGLTLLMVPASWIQGAAGYLLGPVFGFLFAWLTSLIAGSISFWLAGTTLRRFIERKARRDVRFLAIDRAIGDEGHKLVMLLRLSPVSPYNVVNYALGLTQVRFRDYVLGTALGSIPPVLIYTYIGSSVGNVEQLLEGSAAGQASWMHAVGLLTTIVATVLVTRFAQRAVAKALGTASDPPTPTQGSHA
jgi:uncharacterized membrane protein YdjX (TVP38/TMEM64 family)